MKNAQIYLESLKEATFDVDQKDAVVYFFDDSAIKLHKQALEKALLGTGHVADVQWTPTGMLRLYSMSTSAVNTINRIIDQYTKNFKLFLAKEPLKEMTEEKIDKFIQEELNILSKSRNSDRLSMIYEKLSRV